MNSQAPAWRVVGASVAGIGHRRNGRGCDDAHASLRRGDGVLLLAAADGAGSARFGAAGAECAAGAALTAADDLLSAAPQPRTDAQWSGLLRAAVERVHASLEGLAAQAGEGYATGPAEATSVRHYDTTLQLVVVAPETIAAAQVGDGIVVAEDAGGGLRALTRPDHGEYVNGTFFVTEPDFRSHIQVFVGPLGATAGVALLSDGLERQALETYASNAPFAPFFAPLFRFARQREEAPERLEHALTEFLASERISASTDDDTTIVLAVREPVWPTRHGAAGGTRARRRSHERAPA